MEGGEVCGVQYGCEYSARGSDGDGDGMLLSVARHAEQGSFVDAPIMHCPSYFADGWRNEQLADHPHHSASDRHCKDILRIP